MSDVANEISNLTADLTGFHAFVGEQLKQGKLGLSPEEALDIWRTDHPLPEDFEETVEALREALDDLKAGDLGRPFEEFDVEFRARHNIPPRK
jgi:hypothetical protein